MAVDRFVITIARERDARSGDPHATIMVEVSEGRANATELTVRAGKGGSVDRASLPVVDVLMQALSADEARAARGSSTASVDRGAESAPTGTAPAAPARRRSTRTAAAGGRRSRKTAPASDSGRAYRRMPEPDEVLAAYQEVGTVSGLADHFGVPLHTVKGWARRLRQMGYEFAR